jgi:hypothetical protein
VTTLTLEQRRAIDRAKEELVPKAEQLLKQSGIRSIPRKVFGHSQLRNVIAVARETESPAVVANFIRYQMGRDEKRRSWAKRHGGKALGQRFLDEIEAPSGIVARKREAILGAEPAPGLRQGIEIALIRHFLGFASRYLKFLDLDRNSGGPQDGNGEEP